MPIGMPLWVTGKYVTKLQIWRIFNKSFRWTDSVQWLLSYVFWKLKMISHFFNAHENAFMNKLSKWLSQVTDWVIPLYKLKMPTFKTFQACGHTLLDQMGKWPWCCTTDLDNHYEPQMDWITQWVVELQHPKWQIPNFTYFTRAVSMAY